MFSSKTSSNFSFTFSSFGRYLGTWLTMRKTRAKSLFFLIAFRAFCSLLLSAIGVYNIWKANFVSCQVNGVRLFHGNYSSVLNSVSRLEFQVCNSYALKIVHINTIIYRIYNYIYDIIIIYNYNLLIYPIKPSRKSCSSQIIIHQKSHEKLYHW